MSKSKTDKNRRFHEVIAWGSESKINQHGSILAKNSAKSKIGEKAPNPQSYGENIPNPQALLYEPMVKEQNMKKWRQNPDLTEKCNSTQHWKMLSGRVALKAGFWAPRQTLLNDELLSNCEALTERRATIAGPNASNYCRNQFCRNLSALQPILYQVRLSQSRSDQFTPYLKVSLELKLRV